MPASSGATGTSLVSSTARTATSTAWASERAPVAVGLWSGRCWRGGSGGILVLESKVVISFLSLAKVCLSESDTDIPGKSFKQILLFWMKETVKCSVSNVKNVEALKIVKTAK